MVNIVNAHIPYVPPRPPCAQRACSIPSDQGSTRIKAVEAKSENDKKFQDDKDDQQERPDPASLLGRRLSLTA